jgi:isochorismate pyruvate lyase
MESVNTLTEVRTRINGIDRELVKLLSERAKMVKAASGFKKNKAAVADPARMQEVILKVRKIGEEYGLDPQLVENIYRTMIDSFIAMENQEFDKRNGGAL